MTGATVFPQNGFDISERNGCGSAYFLRGGARARAVNQNHEGAQNRKGADRAQRPSSQTSRHFNYTCRFAQKRCHDNS